MKRAAFLVALTGTIAIGCGGEEKKPAKPQPSPSPGGQAQASPEPGVSPAPASTPAPSPAPAPSPKPTAGGSATPWTASDDLLAILARDLRNALVADRASLPAKMAIDDTGPSCDAFFAAPDPDTERAWRGFRHDLQVAFGDVNGLTFVDPKSGNATHLLTAKLDETADRTVKIKLELVDMAASRIVWRAEKSGKVGR